MKVFVRLYLEGCGYDGHDVIHAASYQYKKLNIIVARANFLNISLYDGGIL